MNRQTVLIGLGTATILLAFAALIVMATRSVRTLPEELRAWEAKLAVAHQAEVEVVAYERLQHELAQQEEGFARAIPPNEKEPFDLLKQLTLLAEGAGAQQLSVAVKPRTAAQPSNLPGSALSTPTGPPAQRPHGFDDGLPEPHDSALPAGRPQNKSPAPVEHGALYLYPVQMDFEIEFLRLPELLRSLRSLERLLTIQQVTIARSQTALPRQHVTLALTAYTMVSP